MAWALARAWLGLRFVNLRPECIIVIVVVVSVMVSLMFLMVWNVDVPDWGWCPLRHFGLSRYALRRLFLKLHGNLLSLKASRTLSKIHDIDGVVAGVDDDYGHS